MPLMFKRAGIHKVCIPKVCIAEKNPMGVPCVYQNRIITGLAGPTVAGEAKRMSKSVLPNGPRQRWFLSSRRLSDPRRGFDCVNGSVFRFCEANLNHLLHLLASWHLPITAEQARTALFNMLRREATHVVLSENVIQEFFVAPLPLPPKPNRHGVLELQAVRFNPETGSYSLTMNSSDHFGKIIIFTVTGRLNRGLDRQWVALKPAGIF